MPVGMALMGKPSAEVEGDSLEDFEPDPDEAVVAAVLADPTAPQPVLARATTRVLYDAFAFHRTRHQALPEPTVTCAIARDTHDAELAPGALSGTHHVLTYSDGFGREIQRKSAAETGPVPLRDTGGRVVLGADGLPLTTTTAHPRWVSSGWTIYDNKGQPVRSFEPFFTDHARFESDVRIGVSAVQFFDPRGRVVARLHPDHTWEKAVFDAYRESNWDASDTVLVDDPAADPDVGPLFRRLVPSDYLPTWFAERASGALGALAQAAAVKAAAHAATPTITHADSLGRSVLTVDHNRFRHGHQPVSDPAVEEFYETRADLDIDGRQLGVRDAFDRVVIARTFNLAGAPILQVGMDTGERRIFTDAAGNPIYSWDGRGHRLRMTYDVLRRLKDVFLSTDGAAEIMVRRMEYGETAADGAAANLRGRIFRVHDESGVATNRRFDFKGNLTAAARQFAADGSAPLDWQQNPALDPEVLGTSTRFDARNRPIALVTPDLTECRYSFDRAGLVQQVGVRPDGSAQATPFIAGVEYDAFARRARIVHGNGVTTTFEYDRRSRRLVRRVSTGPGGALLQDLRYVHDPVGNITGIEDRAQQAVYFANQVVAADCAYTYDALQRLIDASGREHIGQLSEPQPTWNDSARARRAHPADGQAMRRYSERYVYDAVGNLLRVVHVATGGEWTRSYAYTSQSLIDPTAVNNRLTSTQVGSGAAGAESYDHDAHGNMSSMPHLALLVWDHHDRLRATARQVTTAGSPETTWYSYASAGQRVRKLTTRPNGTRASERRYAGPFEVYREFGPNGTAIQLERQTLHVMMGAERIALIETRTQGQDAAPAGQVRYQLADHLGSAAVELDEAARVVSYEEYHPHGSTAFQSVDGPGVTPKRYRYTAMERDEESGLAYHGARYYAPWLGRWTTADPAGLVDGVNLYRYVRNRPSNAVDTTGTEEVDLDVEAEKNVVSRTSISTKGRTFFHVLDWKGTYPEISVGFQMSDIQESGFRVSEGGASAKYGKGVYTFADEGTALSHAGFTREKAIAAFEVGPEVRAEQLEIRRMDGKTVTYIRLEPAGDATTVKPRNLQYLNVGEAHAQGYTFRTQETGRTAVPVRMASDAPDAPRGATSGGSGSGGSGGGGGGGIWNAIKATPKTWAVRGLVAVDTAFAYDTISSQTTTYGQVKETSFWGGRLFGFAIGAKYGMALGPKGAIVGGILGALIGENAIKSVFAIGEAIGSDLVKPAGAETLRTEPSLQRHIQRGIDRATGMDQFNNAMDKMYQSGGR
jgi:RHS repeat-associated protein